MSTIVDTRDLSPRAQASREALLSQIDSLLDLAPIEALSIAQQGADRLILQICDTRSLPARATAALVSLSIACQQGATSLASQR